MTVQTGRLWDEIVEHNLKQKELVEGSGDIDHWEYTHQTFVGIGNGFEITQRIVLPALFWLPILAFHIVRLLASKRLADSRNKDIAI